MSMGAPGYAAGFLLLASVSVTIPADAASWDALRVYTVQTACFDYVFTSVSAGADGTPTLAFNHRSGRTFFVPVGGTVGVYRVTSYEPATRRVFNPATRLEYDAKAGHAILEDAEGNRFDLELGRPLKQADWMAHLVSLDTGEWCLVKPGDELTLSGERLRIEAIAEEAVTVSRNGNPQSVPLASAAEKAKLAALWTNRRNQAEAEVRQAQREREEREKAQAEWTHARPTQRPKRSPSSASFGTEFRYPTEFEVVPGVVDSSGRVIREPFVVPKGFKTRLLGISIESR